MARMRMEYPHIAGDKTLCTECGVVIKSYSNPCCYCGRFFCDEHLSERSPTICAGCLVRLKNSADEVEPLQFYDQDGDFPPGTVV